jgi:hypothetical protein
MGLGVDTLDWFRVSLLNHPSYTIACGIPHRSAVGTLLFMIYTNDSVKYIHVIRSILFANESLYMPLPKISKMLETDIETLPD